MARTFALGVFTLGMIGLAGCARYLAPPESGYAAPPLAPGLAATVAIAKGPGYVTTWFTRIDGKWNDAAATSLTLAPGTHKIDASISLASPDPRGPRFDSALSFTLTAEPGKRYVVRVREPVEVALYCLQTAVWIESQDGSFVSADMPVMLARVFHDTGIIATGPAPLFVYVPAHETHC